MGGMVAHFFSHGTDVTTGDKAKQQQKEADRRIEDERQAARSYNAPDPDDLDKAEETGPPWGSVSITHIFRSGRAKEQSSREKSLHAAASKAGGSSR